jgi:hypothetical protein
LNGSCNAALGDQEQQFGGSTGAATAGQNSGLQGNADAQRTVLRVKQASVGLDCVLENQAIQRGTVFQIMYPWWQQNATSVVCSHPQHSTCHAALQKLEGTDGTGTAVRGVAATVSALLAEASDPDKLCRMFIGWASWV